MGLAMLVLAAVLVLFGLKRNRSSASLAGDDDERAVPAIQEIVSEPRQAGEDSQAADVSDGGTATPVLPAPGMNPSGMNPNVPLEFYGKVLDEASNAVAGATVSFYWNKENPREGENARITQSGSDGRFSFEGAKGRGLSIRISKEGYYTPRPGIWSFGYSDSEAQHFLADPLNPVIFKLRKTGEGVDLITSGKNIRSKLRVTVPKNNMPVRVNIVQRRVKEDGQLVINQTKPELPEHSGFRDVSSSDWVKFKSATNWSFRLSIPGGGLIENRDEFQFEAPEANYLPTVEYQFTKGETNWTTEVKKQFYIAFGQPRRYGWLRVESKMAQETVSLTYVINALGSRNLEPAEKGQPKTPLQE